jgi:hypothetical protein
MGKGGFEPGSLCKRDQSMSLGYKALGKRKRALESTQMAMERFHNAYKLIQLQSLRKGYTGTDCRD